MAADLARKCVIFAMIAMACRSFFGFAGFRKEPKQGDIIDINDIRGWWRNGDKLP
jgi:hypothetical protein